jgi:translocation and assembly module TamB
VKEAPFSRWGLKVEVRGEHSLRARTAVFRGTASAHFQLSGTLGEPRAVGELTVDQGQVLFPFATLDVQLGTVRLSEADPYHPQVNANATTRRYGYDLRMEATGPLQSPYVTLTANPALESSQVLLMVMTGQVPATGVGGTTGQQRLARVGAFVGQGLLNNLTGGNDEDRLEIVTGQQVSLQGRETYQIEYKLNDRWSLVGEYDEFDDYNAGLKWRVYMAGGADGKK